MRELVIIILNFPVRPYLLTRENNFRSWDSRITEAATPMGLRVLGDDAKKERGLAKNS
jgi:hypothetical protein